MAVERTPRDALFAAGLGFLALVAFSPTMYATFWTPRAALLPLATAIGLVLLWLLARRTGPRQAPARAALAFLLVATASTVLADTPAMALLGLYGAGTGLVFVAACLGAWALGASLDERGSRLVERALLAGVGVNVAIALLEALVDLRSFELGLYDGRAIGLLGNPIHLGGLAAAGIALLVPHVPARPVLAFVGLIAAGAAVQVSGTRSGLLAAAVVTVWAGHRLGVRRGAAVVVALALGLGVGSALTRLDAGATVTARLTASGGGGIEGRAEYWWLSRHAVADHPLLGSGPGTFRQATTIHRNEAVARAWGPDRYYADAHNLAVEYAVTTGLLGLGALLAFALLAWRRAAGPLRWFCLGIVVVQLFEPLHVGTTLAALLALGAASSAGAPVPRPKAAAALTGVLVVGALVASGALLVGDFALDQARLDFRRDDARTADRLLRPWPEPAVIRARIETFDGQSGNADAVRDARRWRLRAIERDPTNPSLWITLADSDVQEDRPAAAERGYRTLLTLNPVSTRALNGLAHLAAADGRRDEALALYRRSLEIDPDQPGVEARVEELEDDGP